MVPVVDVAIRDEDVGVGRPDVSESIDEQTVGLHEHNYCGTRPDLTHLMPGTPSAPDILARAAGLLFCLTGGHEKRQSSENEFADGHEGSFVYRHYYELGRPDSFPTGRFAVSHAVMPPANSLTLLNPCRCKRLAAIDDR